MAIAVSPAVLATLRAALKTAEYMRGNLRQEETSADALAAYAWLDSVVTPATSRAKKKGQRNGR